MPLTDKNQLLIAYKRLLGKAHTNPSYGISNETIGAYIQAASSQIFGEDHSLNKQLVTFTVHSLASGVYEADLETGQYQDSSPIAHVFELKLKDNLAILNFNTGTAVKDEIGLQLLSDSLDSTYYPKLFKIVNGQRQEIAKYSAINWLIDYASGILFVQDSLQEPDLPPDVPWEVDAYVYTGKYLDQKVQEAGQTGGVIGSPSDDLLIIDSDAVGDTDVIPGTVAIIFEDPIGSIPQPDYKAAIAYHEGELDFYTQDLNSNNIVMNLSGSVLSASNIGAYGPTGSIQFHNSEDVISGSEGLIWDETNSFLTASNLFTNVITASYITASNIESSDATITSLVTETINVNTINLAGGGSSIPAAGLDTQIQYNNNGYLGATDKFFISQDASTFSSVVKDTENSISLFVNSSLISSEKTSGLLLSNTANDVENELLINRQYDGTTQIYKINSDLPLYINSHSQNKITAGTSKIDMSTTTIELWPNSSHYFKLSTTTDTISTTLHKFKLGIQLDDNSKFCLFKYIPPDQNSYGDLKIYLANEDYETIHLNMNGLNVPKFLSVGSGTANGLASFFYNSTNSGTRSIIQLADFTNSFNHYSNIKYERENSEGVLSFEIESTAPSVSFYNNRVEIGSHTDTSLLSYYDDWFESTTTNRQLPLAGTNSSITTISNKGLFVQGNAFINGTSYLGQMRTKKSVVNGPSFIHDGYLQIKQNLTSDNSSDSPRGLTLTSPDDCAYRSWKIYLSNSTSNGRNGESLSFYFVDYVDYSGNPNCDDFGVPTGETPNYNTGLRGYINSDATNLALNFTGQHRNRSDTIDLNKKEEYLGLIVVSDGTYASFNANNITINEALPKVSLASKRNQKSAFGVVSDMEDENAETRQYALGNFVSVSKKTADDTRLAINSLGEGGIWITNINGNLENGDYITTCEIPGYGMKQDDDLLHNYTVAKITCDCDFNLESPIYICEEFEYEGTMYKRAFVGCTYHCG